MHLNMGQISTPSCKIVDDGKKSDSNISTTAAVTNLLSIKHLRIMSQLKNQKRIHSKLQFKKRKYMRFNSSECQVKDNAPEVNK